MATTRTKHTPETAREIRDELLDQFEPGAGLGGGDVKVEDHENHSTVSLFLYGEGGIPPKVIHALSTVGVGVENPKRADEDRRVEMGYGRNEFGIVDEYKISDFSRWDAPE